MGGCVVAQKKSRSAEVQKGPDATIQAQEAKSQAAITAPSKTQPNISTKQIKTPVLASTPPSLSGQDSLAGKYRLAMKQLIMKTVSGLPNSMSKRGVLASSSDITTRRLVMEIPKFSQFLPCEHTNAIFVRVDEGSMNSMNVLISGSKGTPYAHGLYHFELYCDESFPVGPPKMQILTGRGKVRFNPNLYQCGKICLSLLGTWPGNANETWNPAKSSIFQILISIQSLVMTEDVYFNEPGFESMKSTENGRLNNEGYSNVVKLANIRHAMIDMIRMPPYGFQDVVRKHFSIKKADILQDCQKWISEKNRPFLNCSQNPHYESMIMSNGYGVLLEKQVQELKAVLDTLPGLS